MARSILRFRLLSSCMMLCGVFLALKVADIVNGTEHLHQLLVNPAYAEAAKEEAKAEAKKEATKDEAKKDEKAKEGEASGEEAKKEGEHSGEKKEEKPNLPAHTEAVAPRDTAQPFSQTEMDLLQSLSERREAIDKYELRAAMEGLLKQYNDKQDAQIRSLVKIYETMKPKDAARIFEELDMPTLLLVVDKMSERKAAPVLANMTAKKAKEVTVQLAEQRKAALPVVSGASAPDAGTVSPQNP